MTKVEIKKMWSDIRATIWEKESSLPNGDPVRRELFHIRSKLDRAEEQAWAYADK